MASRSSSSSHRLVLLVAAALVALATPQRTEAQAQSLAQCIAMAPQLRQLGSLLLLPQYAPVAQLLNDPSQQLTLFAPSDSAVAGAGLDPSQTRLVSSTLLYHLVPGRHSSADLMGRDSFLPTLLNDQAFVLLNGKSNVLHVFSQGGALKLSISPDNADLTGQVVQADIPCGRSIMHVVSRVMPIPVSASEAAKRGGEQELVTRLREEGLLATADSTPGITILAPTNDAFRRFQDVLHGPQGASIDRRQTYAHHIVIGTFYSPLLRDGAQLPTMSGRSVTVRRMGNTITVDGVPITSADSLIRNGVVHVIGDVLPQ